MANAMLIRGYQFVYRDSASSQNVHIRDTRVIGFALCGQEYTAHFNPQLGSIPRVCAKCQKSYMKRTGLTITGDPAEEAPQDEMPPAPRPPANPISQGSRQSDEKLLDIFYAKFPEQYEYWYYQGVTTREMKGILQIWCPREMAECKAILYGYGSPTGRPKTVPHRDIWSWW